MADFSGADLRGARFARANLSGSEFWASALAAGGLYAEHDLAAVESLVKSSGGR